MGIEAILGLLGSGLGVFILKLYADWRNAKRGDKQDAVGAWQQIADRETARMKELSERAAQLEKKVLEQEVYIEQLEKQATGAHLKLPTMEPAPQPAKKKGVTTIDDISGINLPDISQTKKPTAPAGGFKLPDPPEEADPMDDKFDL